MSKIDIRIDPVPKPRMTVADKWKKRPIVTRYFGFKDELTTICSLGNFELGDKYKVEFLIGMPKSWSDKKKKQYFGKPHKQKPDLDNLIKALNDCLRKEDMSVHYVEANKIWWNEGRIIIYNK